MNATYDKRSWEKCKVLNLENGWTAYEQYNTCHGSYVSALHSPDGKIWQASNGSPETAVIINGEAYGGAENANRIFGGDKYIDLPDFAQEWQDGEGFGRLVRPKYKIK